MSRSFGNTITYLRKEKNISQKQASEDLGISQALLSHYEKGIRECGLNFVVKLADYYNVSCDYLLGRSAERNTQTSNENMISTEGTNQKAMLENLNRKVISNCIDFIFRVLSSINQREITKITSDILMINIYAVLRELYKINSENNEEFFSVPSYSYTNQSNGLSAQKTAKLQEKIFILSKSRKFDGKVAMSYDIITEEYSDIASSILSLIHNAEKSMK